MAIRVLIISDEPVQQPEHGEALQRVCPDWHIIRAGSLTEALPQVSGQAPQVVYCDVRQPQTTGVQLLNQAAKQWPGVSRLISGESAERDMIAQFITGSHHFVPKQIEPEKLRSELIRAMTLDRWLGSEEIKNLVSHVRTFPTVPSRYFEVLKALRSENPSAERVGEIISQDLAMFTKILQTLNSAHYGFRRQITDPTEAVIMLGFEMVKSLVLCIQVFSQFEPHKLSIASIDEVWKHSMRVAQGARKIALFEKAGREISDQAFTAGLLHDIGRLILIAEFPEKYKQVQDQARGGGHSASVVEKEIFGVSHGEISAYLVASWGMPLGLSEAVAYHHFPFRSEGVEFGVVCAVHAADALANEVSSESDGLVHDGIDERYLAQLGLLGRAQVWRELLAGQPISTPEPPPKAMAPVEEKPQPTKATQPEPPAEDTSSMRGIFKRIAFWKKS